MVGRGRHEDLEHRPAAELYDLADVRIEGPYAVITRARERASGQIVGIERPASRVRSDPVLCDGFRRLAETTSGLSHPNIVQVFAVARDDESIYGVVEWPDRGSLARELEESGPLPEPLLRRVAEDAGAALAYAEQRGIPCPDAAPGNLFLFEDSGVKVAGPEFSGDPRQSSSGSAARANAVHRLCRTLLHLATGRDREQPHSADYADLPRWLADLVARGLADDPRVRYRDATDFLASLEHCLDAGASAEPSVTVLTPSATSPVPPPDPAYEPVGKPASPTAPFPFRKISDQYRILGKPLKGGMGTVWPAEEIGTGRRVAIKRIHKALLLDENALERFRREAQSIARLNHPNILKLLQVGCDDTGEYLVLEWAEGGSLNSLLRERGRLPVTELLDLARSVGGALGYAHRKGVVHRDVKPHNILLDELGNPKLSDFGLARSAGDDTITSGGRLGSMAYMAPEQQNDAREADERADLYGLAKTLYHLATGHVPSTVRPADLPRAVRAPLMRALETEPNRRHASVDAFLRHLERSVRLTRLAKPALALAVASALLLSAFLYSTWPRKDEAPAVLGVLALAVERPADCAAGSETALSVSISNPGAGACRGVVVRASVPPQVGVVRASEGGIRREGEVEWTIGSLPKGGQRRLSMTLRALRPGSVRVTVRALGDGLDPIQHAAAFEIEPRPAALALDVRGPDPAPTGSEAEWSIGLRNEGGSPCEHTVLTVAIPAGATVVRTVPETARRGRSLSWTFGRLRAGERIDVRLALSVDRPGEVRLDAEATGDGVDRAVSSGTSRVLQRPASLTLHAQSPPQSLAGEDLTCAVTIENTGGSVAEGTTLLARLSDGSAFVTSTPEPSGRDGQLRWDLGSVPAGERRKASLVIRADRAGELRLEFTVRADGVDAVSADATTAVRFPPAVLALDAGCGENIAQGEKLEWRIRVRNAGGSSCTGVRVRAKLPAGVRFASATAGGRHDNGTVSWKLGSLEAGGETELRIEAEATRSGKAVLEVIASADSAGEVRHVAATTVRPRPAQLRVSASRADDLRQGDRATWRIQVENAGGVACKNLLLRADLTAADGTDFVAATDGGVARGRVVEWELAELEAGASLTPSLTLRMREAGDVTVPLTASADSVPAASGSLRFRVSPSRDPPPDIRVAPFQALIRNPPDGLLYLGVSASGYAEFLIQGTGEPPAGGTPSADAGIVLVGIPGTPSYVMGPRANQIRGREDQGLRPGGAGETCALSPFLLAKYEVTIGQWERLLDRAGIPARHAARRALARAKRMWSDHRRPFCPVTREIALEILERNGLTLPTEAQWEYACRGGGDGIWATGDDESGLPEVACLNDVAPRPVGELRATAFGLHDIHGNAREWCLDDYVPFGEARIEQGTGLRTFSSADGARTRFGVLKGGSCRDGPADARAFVRDDVPLLRAPSYAAVRPAMRIP